MERETMPEKRKGLTQLSVQMPDALLAAIDEKRGARSRNAYLCELVAAHTGMPFVLKGRGRPKSAPKTDDETDVKRE